MAAQRYLCIASCVIVTALKVFSETAYDLKEGLESRSRTKQEAGYHTDSGIYRRCLRYIAVNKEPEIYRCLKDVSSQCTFWNVHEESQDGRSITSPPRNPFCKDA